MTNAQIATLGSQALKFASNLQKAADKWGDDHGYEDGVHSSLNDAADKLEAASGAITIATER